MTHTEPNAPEPNGVAAPPPTMTLRQLARTVRRGQKITFWLYDGQVIDGYVAGVDDEAWFVLAPARDGDRVRKLLIMKRMTAMLEPHDKRTYANETHRREMEYILSSFRPWLAAQGVLSSTKPPWRVDESDSSSGGEDR